MQPPTVLSRTVRQLACSVPHQGTRTAAATSTELDIRPLLDDSPARLPEVGATFAGFALIRELGRGSFGRAYLARQMDLADRPVALKVAWDAGQESRTLAQLQHPHIVPIHSAHRVGSLTAICMPYYGATTLVDVTRELFGGAVSRHPSRAAVGRFRRRPGSHRRPGGHGRAVGPGRPRRPDGLVPVAGRPVETPDVLRAYLAEPGLANHVLLVREPPNPG